MRLSHDTFDHRIQLGASRRRLEDAETLHAAERWAGAMYVGGYAIECALKALICATEGKSNFKETKFYNRERSKASSHSLVKLMNELQYIQRIIATDRTGAYKKAWKDISDLWQKDELRYWNKQGQHEDSERFMEAIKKFHAFLVEHL